MLFITATRIFKIRYVAHITFLLDSASLESARLKHKLKNLRYILLSWYGRHICFSPEREVLGMDKNR